MSEPLLNIDETQFEAAMVELSERPELFDGSFDENACPLATAYLVLECSSVAFSTASEDVCKKHVCYLLTNKQFRNELTSIFFKHGKPTKSHFQTVAQLLMQIAFQRYMIHQSMTLSSTVTESAHSST